jgi:hypothetical protein
MTVREESVSGTQDTSASLLADKSKKALEVYRLAVMRRKHFYPDLAPLTSRLQSPLFAIGLNRFVTRGAKVSRLLQVLFEYGMHAVTSSIALYLLVTTRLQ